MANCGAGTEAKIIRDNLLDGIDFDLPDVNLGRPEYQLPSGSLPALPNRLENADLTSGTVDGPGTFDQLMKGIAAHLRKEFDQSRITGQQYTEAFVGAATGAMGTAVQFLLGRDASYWQAVNAQLQAQTAQINIVTARVQLELAKAQLAMAQIDTRTKEAEYALTTLRLATEDQNYCLAKAQTEGAELDNATKTYTNANILPAQRDLLREQVEVQRAQTLDNRTDGAAVKGSVGKQKELYSQQITSYQRDAEMKAIRPFIDAWITMKTIDEGLTPPPALNNSSLDTMLNRIKVLNGIDS